MDRVGYFLSRILENPDRWIRITKLKHKRYASKETTQERIEVMKQVAIALDLMGVQYEIKDNNHYTIKLVSPKLQFVDPAPYFMNMDFSDLEKQLMQRMTTTGIAVYRMNGRNTITGRRPQMIIIDDIMEKP